MFSPCLEHFLMKISGLFVCLFVCTGMSYTAGVCVCGACVCVGGGSGERWPELDLMSSSIAFPYFLVTGSLPEPELIFLVKFAG